MAKATQASHAVRIVAKPLRITLELEPDGEPIAGRLHADERPEHSFYGWLEFAAALEAACEEAIAQPRESAASAAQTQLGGEKT